MLTILNTIRMRLLMLFGMLVWTISMASDLKAQEKEGQSLLLLQEDLEQLTMEDEEQNWEDELEELSQRLENPINLNTATRSQLEQFPFLSDLQIENLLAYLYIHGQMKSIYELLLVEEMDRRTIDLLLPFVHVSEVESPDRFPSLNDLWKRGRHEALARFDVPFYTRKGYEKNYLGPPVYHSLRYSFRSGEYVQAGVTAEKDAGEPFGALHNRKGYDFYSYYLQVSGLGRLKTLVLGNYRLSFGMGLTLNAGLRLGKQYSIASSAYRSTGIRKHSSTDEHNYFRGIAATVQAMPDLEISAFYSHRALDGTVTGGTITSIDDAGLHRTENEVRKIHTFAQQMTGGNITWRRNSLKIGATGIYYFFDRPYEPNLRKYAMYNLRGNHFYNVSLDYSYSMARFSLNGEAAKGKKGYAFLNRLTYALTSDYRLMLIHRFYSYNYWAWYARSFGESGKPQNENGWYLAAEADLPHHWRLFASMDFFSFPWWKYRISKPSQGMDGMFQATYTPLEELSMYVNYRYKRKERDVTGTNGEVILPTHHHKTRFRLTYAPGCFRFQTTADYNHFHSQGKEPAMGWLISQSASCALPFFPLSLCAQGSCFHTDDYDSRVYAYEKGLLYTFYVPSFSGHGFRYSVHLRYDMKDWLMLIAKIGQTIYTDRDEISSGNDLIKGNKKTDLQLQVRLKF